MSAKPYHIDLPAPGGGTSSFFVLDVPHQVSSELPPKERRKLIRIMEELIQDLHSNNKNLQELIRLREDASTRAIFGGRIVAMDELRRLWKAKYLDQSNWTLCQLLRVSENYSRNSAYYCAILSDIFVDAVYLYMYKQHPVPTRIAEAVGPITYIIENFKRINGRDKTDPAPTLFLAVALSRIPGEEERAIRTFTEALKALDEPLPVQANGVNKPFRNVVWARANMARMYRQMGRIKEAKEQEKLAR